MGQIGRFNAADSVQCSTQVEAITVCRVGPSRQYVPQSHDAVESSLQVRSESRCRPQAGPAGKVQRVVSFPFCLLTSPRLPRLGLPALVGHTAAMRRVLPLRSTRHYTARARDSCQ